MRGEGGGSGQTHITLLVTRKRERGGTKTTYYTPASSPSPPSPTPPCSPTRVPGRPHGLTTKDMNGNVPPRDSNRHTAFPLSFLGGPAGALPGTRMGIAPVAWERREGGQTQGGGTTIILYSSRGEASGAAQQLRTLFRRRRRRRRRHPAFPLTFLDDALGGPPGTRI